MSKSKQSGDKAGGPFLAAALLCQNIIDDSSGMLSAIHILDKIRITLPPGTPEDAPSKKQPIPLGLNILLMFKSGSSPGKYELRIVAEYPDGKRSVAAKQPLNLSSEASGGGNVKTALTLPVFSSGLFWLDVALNRKLMTRIPLDIQIQREELAPTVKKKS